MSEEKQALMRISERVDRNERKALIVQSNKAVRKLFKTPAFKEQVEELTGELRAEIKNRVQNLKRKMLRDAMRIALEPRAQQREQLADRGVLGIDIVRADPKTLICGESRPEQQA